MNWGQATPFIGFLKSGLVIVAKDGIPDKWGTTRSVLSITIESVKQYTCICIYICHYHIVIYNVYIYMYQQSLETIYLSIYLSIYPSIHTSTVTFLMTHDYSISNYIHMCFSQCINHHENFPAVSLVQVNESTMINQGARGGIWSPSALSPLVTTSCLHETIHETLRL